MSQPSAPSRNQALIQHVACAICRQLLKDPRDLPCGHTFCHDCLTPVHNISNNNNNENVMIRCFLCLNEHEVENVSRLPTNEMMSELSSLFERTNISQGCPPPKCDNCFPDHQEQAHKYCEKCEVNFCEGCLSTVHSARAFVSHRLRAPVDLEKLKVYQCSNHQDQNLVFWCQTCKTLVCQVCLITEHISHQEQDLQTAVTNVRSQLKRQLNQAEPSKTTTKQMKSSLENKKQLQQTEFDGYKTKIEQIIKLLNQDTNNQHNEQMNEWKEKNEECLKTLKSLEVGKSMGEFLMRGTEDRFEVLHLVKTCETLLDSTNHLDCEFQVKRYLLSEQVFNSTFELLKECLGVGGFELNSTILDLRMRRELKKMFGPGRFTFKLIPIPFTNTEKDQASFQNGVVGKGPTLVIIRSTTNYVFGAYIHDTFTGGSGEWIPGSRETFLYTFGNGDSQPLKLLHNGSTNGIHISGSCGLHLGQAGYDLRLFCSIPLGQCKPSVYTVVAPGYGPTTVNCSTMAGTQTWTASVVEVFSVTKTS